MHEIIEIISAKIDAVHDVAARPRLKQCLPMLERAVQAWVPGGSNLALAAATPTNCTILSADDWPSFEPVPKLTVGEVALAVVAAVNDSDPDASIILGGASLLLGNDGRSMCNRDHAVIAQAGKLPMTVALLAPADGSVAYFLTTIAIDVISQREAATVH